MNLPEVDVSSRPWTFRAFRFAVTFCLGIVVMLAFANDLLDISAAFFPRFAAYLNPRSALLITSFGWSILFYVYLPPSQSSEQDRKALLMIVILFLGLFLPELLSPPTELDRWMFDGLKAFSPYISWFAVVASALYAAYKDYRRVINGRPQDQEHS